MGRSIVHIQRFGQLRYMIGGSDTFDQNKAPPSNIPVPRPKRGAPLKRRSQVSFPFITVPTSCLRLTFRYRPFCRIRNHLPCRYHSRNRIWGIHRTCRLRTCHPRTFHHVRTGKQDGSRRMGWRSGKWFKRRVLVNCEELPTEKEETGLLSTVEHS